MLTLNPPTRSGPPLREVVVLERRLNVSAHRLALLLDVHASAAWAIGRPIPLEGAGSLEPLRPFCWAPRAQAWHARARLSGRGLRLVRHTRVELELSAWSHEATMLRLRPVARSPQHWGARRLRRYFELAHLAADHLERGLAELARSVPTGASRRALPPFDAGTPRCAEGAPAA